MNTKGKILLVEDEPIIQRVHKAFLEKMGFEVKVVATGKAALTNFQNNYRLIILDGGLPDISGFQIGKHIREQERQLNLPRKTLILLSAYPYEEVKQECKAAGIDDFAIKPVEYKKLKEMIERNLSNNHRETSC